MDVSNRKTFQLNLGQMGYISILLLLACGNVPLTIQRSVSAWIPVALVTIFITKSVWHVPRVDFQTLLGLIHPKFAEVVQLERFPSRVQWNVHFVNRESIPRSRRPKSRSLEVLSEALVPESTAARACWHLALGRPAMFWEQCPRHCPRPRPLKILSNPLWAQTT